MERNASTSVAMPTATIKSNFDLVVFSHLRWNFVYQRPQHIISRLSKMYSVLFIEEPIGCGNNPEDLANIRKVNAGLTVFQPKVNSIEEIPEVLYKYLQTDEIKTGWFYSASFLPLFDTFKFDTVVYDCMDELTLFKNAPQSLLKQEKELLAHTNVVFTGGKSLYEAKSKIHNNVFCFPSSVDELHFERAANGIDIPLDIAPLVGPVVGYYGVIDERIDLELLHETAKLVPDVHFVMIGPLAKITKEDLPVADNIHYLGMRPYSLLPNYLKKFDIAMMPFALNDATRFISPTKTLEYMAARKPIISTPVVDVVRDYKDCISVVSTAEEFAQSILRILADDTQEMNYQYEYILSKTSWDSTVNSMNNCLVN